MTKAGLAVLLASLALTGPAAAQAFDPQRSRIEFDVRTRVGPFVRGHFPAFDGAVETLPDGRHRVRLRLDAGAVQVGGSRRQTAIARGPQLFDAAHHRWIEFVSEPYPPDLARHGGELQGRLRMRGVEREERFVLAPSSCADPGLGCAVLAQGQVSRDDYGLDGWRWVLADRVRFRLHVRFDD